MISNAEEVAKKNSRKLYPCFSPNLRKFLEEHEHNTELTIEFSNKAHYCVIGDVLLITVHIIMENSPFQ